MSSRPIVPDIWHARYMFAIGDASASLFDVSLSSSHIKIASADHPPDVVQYIGDRAASDTARDGNHKQTDVCLLLS